MQILAIIAAIIPPLLLAYGIYHFDKFQRENLKDLVFPFLGGMLIVPVAAFLEQMITTQYAFDLNSVWDTVLLSFLGVSLVEEGLKLLVFFSLVFFWKFFDELFDGFVYAVMIAMGFALVENIFYVWEFGMGTALIRAFTAVPAHAVMGMISGYFFARAKFEKDERVKWIAIGFLLAFLVHGIYDFLILQMISEPLMAGSAVLIYGLAIACWIRMKKVLRETEKALAAKAETKIATVKKIDNDDLTDEFIRDMKE